jgi:phosphopantetheinyl transferase (holo-ACP synthase)
MNLNSAIKEITTLLNLDKDFDLKLYSEGGSNSKNYREFLRQNLFEHISKISPHKPLQSILELNQIPNHPLISISISHCQSIGGYCVELKPKAIGFDIEETTRVNPKTVRRICEEEELNSAPNPAALWSAKEASFKAMYNFNPDLQTTLLLSEIEIYDWNLKKYNLNTCKGRIKNSSKSKCTQTFSGVVCALDQYTISVFVIS